MIRSFGDGRTQRLFENGRRRGFRGLDYDRALMLLDALDAAKSLTPLRVLQAARLHPLTGPRQGEWAMTVNARWRVTFRFDESDAHDVRIRRYSRAAISSPSRAAVRGASLNVAVRKTPRAMRRGVQPSTFSWSKVSAPWATRSSTMEFAPR